MLKIDNKIYAVKGRVNHIYILNGKHIIIFDPEFPSSAIKVLRFIENNLKRNLKEVKLICATHAHVDHIGGLSKITSLLQVDVALPIKSKNIIEGKEKYKLSILDIFCDFSLLVKSRNFPTFKDLLTTDIVGMKLLPNRFNSKVTKWLKEGETLPYAPEWCVIETPGHSTDSVCFYNKKNQSLITGDLIAVINKQAYLNPIVMENRTLAIQSLKKLYSLEVKNLYSGYGSPVKINSIQDIIKPVARPCCLKLLLK